MPNSLNDGLEIEEAKSWDVWTITLKYILNITEDKINLLPLLISRTKVDWVLLKEILKLEQRENAWINDEGYPLMKLEEADLSPIKMWSGHKIIYKTDFILDLKSQVGLVVDKIEDDTHIYSYVEDKNIFVSQAKNTEE